MKKLIASLVAAASFAGVAYAQTEALTTENSSIMGDLSAKLEGQFVSESIMFGKRVAGSAFNSHLQAAMPVYDGEAYVGVFGNHPFQTKVTGITGLSAAYGANEQGPREEIYAGITYPVYEQFSVDAGYTYYWYTDQKRKSIYNQVGRSHEVYVGVNADVLLEPAVYAYYDFNLQQFRVEASIGYSFDLEEQFGLDNTSIELGAHAGWLHSECYNGDQRPVNTPKWHNSFVYYGANADVVYTINEVAKVSVGGAYAGNNDGKGVHNGHLNNLGGQNKIFWNAKVSFGF